MNMAYKATDVVCKMIRDSVDPEEFTTIKKTTAEKFVNGYGKSAMANVTTPRKLVEQLNTTPEQMERGFLRDAVRFGSRGIVRSQCSCGEPNDRQPLPVDRMRRSLPIPIAPISRAKRPKMAINILAHIFPVCSPRPSEEELPSGRRVNASKHSRVMETANPNDSRRSSRPTAMAGEISLMTSIVNSFYIYAHKTFERNRPPQ